ncbi:MAG: alpha/beta hydrolase [Lachnospiraceae bacterium]|nr:alpha/beta hydrolase [Lachnospiraceae bacterium]
MKKGTTAALAAAGLFGLSALSGRYFYDLAIVRDSKFKIPEKKDPEKERAHAEFLQKVNDWMEKQPRQDCTITSYDGLKLHAVYMPAYEPTKRTAILVHGYRASIANDFGEMLPFYRDSLKCNLLLVDDRGHNRSEGDYIGFGWHDHYDIEKWIDFLIEKHGSSAEIFLHGVSMGAAIVMITAGGHLPPQVKGVIEDCGYTSIEGEMTYCMHSIYHLPIQPIFSEVNYFTQKKAGYSLYDCDPKKAMAKTELPFLLIHGGTDDFVPTYMVHELFDACASSDKKKVIIQGAGHALSYHTNREMYEQALLDFYGTH